MFDLCFEARQELHIAVYSAVPQADVNGMVPGKGRHTLAGCGNTAHNFCASGKKDIPMRIVFASATALLIVAGVAPAFGQAQPQELSQPTTQPAVTANTSASSGAAGNKMVCRYMFHNGSLIKTQTCRTEREWESVRFQNQSEVTGMQMRSMTSQPGGH
ncbi:MAG TPA: hypothetical protein VLC74_07220 [Rhizomicrobium sp.]|nr:hypothetical protein [Rhizomicrobium sp.]